VLVVAVRIHFVASRGSLICTEPHRQNSYIGVIIRGKSYFLQNKFEDVFVRRFTSTTEDSPDIGVAGLLFGERDAPAAFGVWKVISLHFQTGGCGNDLARVFE
jgi:hypothetical protein